MSSHGMEGMVGMQALNKFLCSAVLGDESRNPGKFCRETTRVRFLAIQSIRHGFSCTLFPVWRVPLSQLLTILENYCLRTICAIAGVPLMPEISGIPAYISLLAANSREWAFPRNSYCQRLKSTWRLFNRPNNEGSDIGNQNIAMLKSPMLYF